MDSMAWLLHCPLHHQCSHLTAVLQSLNSVSHARFGNQPDLDYLLKLAYGLVWRQALAAGQALPQ